MKSFKDPEVKRALIMEHYLNPQNKGDLKGLKVIDKYSEHCVDELHLGVKIVDQKIAKVKFQAIGCAVFLSSTDLLINRLKGLSVKSAEQIIKNYRAMIVGEDYDQKLLGNLVIYQNVASHLNRLACAEMAALAFQRAMLEV